MDRRLALTSSLLILLLSSTGNAQQPPVQVEKIQGSTSFFDSRINFSLDADASLPPDSFLDDVTMRNLPQGSLYTRYDGLHSVVMRQMRSHGRRFMRQALREGWYNDDETASNRSDLLRKIDNTADPQINGAWWTRRWWESFSEERGGAPSTPYVQTLGSEITWRLGPLKATNTLRFRVDYLAIFEVDPDPVEPDHPAWTPPVALDLRALEEEGLFGPTFRVSVKPRLQIGMPSDVDMSGLLRGASLQVSFEIWNLRQKLVKGDVSVRWRPDDGVTASFEVALVSW